jgi:uncharacterized protein YegL
MGEPIETPASRSGAEKTYVAMILDKSGSMQPIKKVTVSGFNEHVQTLISEGKDGTEIFASLVLFDGGVKPEFFNAPVYALRELTEDSYKPNGSTAMFDAVGYALDRLAAETDINDEKNAYLVMVFSDGEENASVKWNSSKLAERIQELQKSNRWTFTYVGANQDLATVQEALKMDDSNMYRGWDADDGTSLQMMASSKLGLENYMGLRKGGSTSVKNFYDPNNIAPVAGKIDPPPEKKGA